MDHNLWSTFMDLEAPKFLVTQVHIYGSEIASTFLELASFFVKIQSKTGKQVWTSVSDLEL